MSVKIVDYKLRETLEGKKFYALVLQGDIEIVTSQTGKQYLSTKKASLPCTFNEDGCKAIIGTELQGTIERVECAPYDYTNSTGDIISLNFRYEYKEMAQSQKLDVTIKEQQLQYHNLIAA